MYDDERQHWRHIEFLLSEGVDRRHQTDSTIDEYDLLAQESLEFLRDNPHEQLGVINASSQLEEWGRLPRVEENFKEKGKDLGDGIRDDLFRNGLRRPIQSSGASWYRDRFNRIINTPMNP